MELINDIFIMVFLGILAASGVTFPILFLIQRHKQHKELIKTLRDMDRDKELS